MVEDNEDDGLLAYRVLRDAGIPTVISRVDTEADIRRAFVGLCWDIVLSDYRVPGLEIDVILDLFGALAPTVPVIVVTGTLGEEAVAALMRRGVADVVLKHRLPQRLAPIIVREVDYARKQHALELRQQNSEAVLAFFNGAVDWREAMQDSLDYLTTTFEAACGMMWEVGGSARATRLIACWTAPGLERLQAALQAKPRALGDAMADKAMLNGDSLVIPSLTGGSPDASSIVGIAVASGLCSLVCQPLEAGGHRFALSMMFGSDRCNVDDVMAELQAISTSFQPALLRRLIEHERALLLDALDATRSGVIITEASVDAPVSPRILYVNQAMCRMSGYDRSLLLGRTPRILQGPKTDLATLGAIQSALKAAQPISAELINYRRDQTPYLVDMDITPVRDQDQVVNYIAVLTDITSRRQAEQDKQQQEASFRLLFEDNPVPMWVYDNETLAILQVNQAAILHYGWTREEFLRRTVGDICASADCGLTCACVTRDASKLDAEPETHITAGGEPILVRQSSRRIEYQGRIASLTVIWDVTEMERTREELRRSNEILADVTDRLTARTADLVNASRLAGMGSWSVTFKPFSITWSPETFAIVGQDPDTFELDRSSVLACIHPDDRARFRGGYRRMHGVGADRQIEYRIVRPSQEVRVIRELARPRRDAKGRVCGMSGVIQDITDYKMAQDALLRSEKLKTIGQLTGGIAHDFNNLMAVVKLSLNTVLHADTLPADLRTPLAAAFDAVQRSSDVTGAMLSYARRQTLRPRIGDMQTMVETLQPLLMRALRATQRLTLSPSGTAMACNVELDPGQFENALMNLVINARDAVGPNGHIAIAVDVVHLDKPKVCFPDTIPVGDYGRLQIADNGSGIPQDILPKILEPFFTTKPEGAGSGLGLSMVYGFVSQSNGFMSIVSVVGKGTAIELYFPRTGEDASDRHEIATASIDPRNRSVLILEDRDDLRRTMDRIFGHLGFNTIPAVNVDEAMQVLRSPRQVDLLFTDIFLSEDMSGLEVASVASELRPDIAVILTSGTNSHGTGSSLRWPLLSKPFDIDTLIGVLKTSLN